MKNSQGIIKNDYYETMLSYLEEILLKQVKANRTLSN